MDDDALLELATRAAVEAGELLLDRFRGSSSGVSSKSTPTDLVSDADRDAEDLILGLIAGERPDDGVLAEEGGGVPSRSGLRWVVDPLDGTVNYLFGIADWAVSVAVEDDAGALVGVIHRPAAGETFRAVRDRGAELGGTRIRVSDKEDLATALVGTGFSYDPQARAEQAALVKKVLPRVRDIRRAGSAALDLAALACGRLDGFYEAPMEPWDRAAGVLLVEEAGGVVSTLEAPKGMSAGVVAANPRLHRQLEDLVKG